MVFSCFCDIVSTKQLSKNFKNNFSACFYMKGNYALFYGKVAKITFDYLPIIIAHIEPNVYYIIVDGSKIITDSAVKEIRKI